MRDRADWHYKINGGLIPILETPSGELIPESSVIAQYAVDNFDGLPLYPEDKNELKEHKKFMQRADQMMSSYWGYEYGRFKNAQSYKQSLHKLDKEF